MKTFGNSKWKCKELTISHQALVQQNHFFMLVRGLSRSNILVLNMTCVSLENDKKYLAAMKFRPYENKIWVLRRFFFGSCGTIYLTMFVFQFILHIVKIWGTNTLLYPFTNGDTISIIMPILKAFLYFEGVDMLYVYDARRHICTPSSVMEKRFDFYVSCTQNYDKDLWGNFTAVVLLNKWL